MDLKKELSVYTIGVLDLIQRSLCGHNERNTVAGVM